jgi:hypothetical protein
MTYGRLINLNFQINGKVYLYKPILFILKIPLIYLYKLVIGPGRHECIA